LSVIHVSATTTLLGRDERAGRTFPLWIERVTFVVAVALFAAFAGEVNAWIDHPLGGPLTAYVLYPLALLAAAEMTGRAVQRLHGSKL
jgi:hypothetical protein